MRGSAAGESLLRQSAGNELGDAAGGGWVHVRQHGHNVAGGGADLELAIHPGSAPAMTKTADAVGRAIIETERIAAAPRRINLARGKRFRRLRMEQLVGCQRVRKPESIFPRRVIAAGH